MKKKGINKLCYGVLLVLSITFSLFAGLYSGDVNALKHEFQTVPLVSSYYPAPLQVNFDCTSGHCVMPEGGFTSYSNLGEAFGYGLILQFDGDSLDPYQNHSWSLRSPTNSSIVINNNLSYNRVSPKFSLLNNTINSHSGEFRYWEDSLWDVSGLSDFQKFYRLHDISIDESSINPTSILTCTPFRTGSSGNATGNGAVCPGLWNESEYVKSQLLRNSVWTSYSSFYLHSKAIDTESGLHYSNTFSFADLFNSYIPRFSYLQIPLHDLDGYFWDYDELTTGRPIEFAGSFEFDGTFDWHENIQSNGSYFRVKYRGITDEPTTNGRITVTEGTFDCTTNLITLQGGNGLTRLDYSCPWSYDHHYNAIQFALEISGNGNYVWNTDKTWRFTNTYIITDNDPTPGHPLGTTVYGSYIPGDAKHQIPSDQNTDWLSSLTGTFSFDMINPFAPIFSMFTNQSQCVNIPTMASMLHLENPEVCPWFDSTTRSIATPVIGLASAMLVFGFAVRWLGSRSGNFIEDSPSDTGERYSVHNKFRRN